jgi:chemotaxis protein methyltransferase CheR
MTSCNSPGDELEAVNSIDSERENIELELLLDGMYRLYGHDFRNYATPSLKRRIWNFINLNDLRNISSLQEKVLHDRLIFDRLVHSISIPVTEMFRDPLVFKSFRTNVVPLLRTYPYIRIWHAGCSTGEEVYSMAIVLYEEGLYDRTRIYATDMNSHSLKKAQEGIFGIGKMKLYTKNYMDAGGSRSFSEYYTAGYNSVIFKPFLRKNMIFAEHNLATDRSFNEFNVILCRNVMIYFNETLKVHVHRLFHESLSPQGILVLGSKESVEHSNYGVLYEPLDRVEKIYRAKI